MGSMSNPSPTGLTGRNIPKPETTRAFLMNAGLTPPTPTVHHYFETRLVEVPSLVPGAPPEQAYEFIFKCFRNGTVRRWGLARGPFDAAEPLPPPTTEDTGNGRGGTVN